MPQPKSAERDKRVDKAAKAVLRAIKKTRPARERPTVGKPVIVDPIDDGAQAGSKTSPQTSSDAG
jgi:hypothetical protein